MSAHNEYMEIKFRQLEELADRENLLNGAQIWTDWRQERVSPTKRPKKTMMSLSKRFAPIIRRTPKNKDVSL